MTNIEQERARFDAWWEREMAINKAFNDDVTKYVAWRAWQSRCPGGWQVVPVDMTGAMTGIAMQHFDPYDADSEHLNEMWRDVLAAAPQPGEES